MKTDKIFLLITLITLSLVSFGYSSTGSQIPYPIDNDNAVIILGGELGSKKDLEHVTGYFKKNSNFDIYHIDFKVRGGIDACSKSLKDKMAKLPLNQYKKVNFFCFILGGVTLRAVLENETIENLGNIVLIRGPIEERLAKVAVEVYPKFLIKIVKGQTVLDLAKINFGGFPKVNSKIGLIIETKPNTLAEKLIKRVKKKLKKKNKQKTFAYETTTFHPDSLHTTHQDFTYLALDHNQMYQNPQLYLQEVISFFNHGTFGKKADRSKVNSTIHFFPFSIEE